MKIARRSLAGLCVVAALTVVALVSATASAQAPEFGRCIKSTPKAGGYTSAACTATDSEDNDGTYEWQPGPGASNKFTATGGASIFYETHPSGYSGSCTSVKSMGEFISGTDNKHENVTLEWAGCKVVSSPGGAINGAPCQSAGKASGEVATNPLVGEVGWENKAHKKTALLLEPAAGGNFMTFQCAGLNFGTAKGRGRGFLVNIANDSMKSEEALKYKQTKGVQKPTKWHVGEAGEEEAYFESFGEPIPTEQAGATFEEKIQKEEKLELNAVL